MELSKARGLAKALMRQHGLSDWEFTFDRAKTRAGACRPGRRQLSLSAPWTRIHDDDQVRDTILHEIAHAMVGPRHGTTRSGAARRSRSAAAPPGALLPVTNDPRRPGSAPVRQATSSSSTAGRPGW